MGRVVAALVVALVATGCGGTSSTAGVTPTPEGSRASATPARERAGGVGERLPATASPATAPSLSGGSGSASSAPEAVASPGAGQAESSATPAARRSTPLPVVSVVATPGSPGVQGGVSTAQAGAWMRAYCAARQAGLPAAEARQVVEQQATAQLEDILGSKASAAASAIVDAAEKQCPETAG